MREDHDDDRPTWKLVGDRWVVARKARRCAWGCTTGIQPGDTYRRVAGVEDGDFVVLTTCEWCEDGHPRPGSPEDEALIAECEAAAAEMAADEDAELAWCRELLDQGTDDPGLRHYAEARLGVAPLAPYQGEDDLVAGLMGPSPSPAEEEAGSRARHPTSQTPN